MATTSPDGYVNITVVDGTTRTGLLAPDGSFNVVLDDFTNRGIYHPCGAFRVSTGGGTTFQDPSGAINYNQLSAVSIPDPVLTEATSLAGYDFSDAGLTVSASSLIQLTDGNKPTGTTVSAGPPPVFTITGNGTSSILIEGYKLDGFWVDVVGQLNSNIPNTITIRNCSLDYTTLDSAVDYALRQSRVILGPRLIIENCVFNGNKDTRDIQVYLQGNNYIFRKNKIIDHPFDGLALHGYGLVENNIIGPGGYASELHCDLIPVYGTEGVITIRNNFLDHRNRSRLIRPSPIDDVWPLNNCIRITPNTQTDIKYPVIFQGNVLISHSNRTDYTNGWMFHDARATTAEPGVQLIDNYVDPKFSASNGAQGSWGPVFKSAGVITEPDPTMHTGWKDMWTGAALSAAIAPEKNTQALLGYPPELASVLAAMTVQPDATRRGHMGTLVAGLKTDGVWDKLKMLTIFAAHDSQAGLVDWMAPVSTRIATVTNAPTFTTNIGYTTNGTTNYITTGFSPTVVDPNDCSFGLWSKTVGVSANSSSGGASLSNNTYGWTINPRFTGDLCRVRHGSSTIVDVANTDGTGLFTATRDNTSSISIYRNAGLLGTGSAATNLNTYNLGTVSIGRVGASVFVFDARQFLMTFAGQHLTAANVTALHTRLNTYFTAIGALP